MDLFLLKICLNCLKNLHAFPLIINTRPQPKKEPLSTEQCIFRNMPKQKRDTHWKAKPLAGLLNFYHYHHFDSNYGSYFNLLFLNNMFFSFYIISSWKSIKYKSTCFHQFLTCYIIDYSQIKNNMSSRA